MRGPRTTPATGVESRLALRVLLPLRREPIAGSLPLDEADRRALRAIYVWSGLVLLAFTVVVIREARTLSYPLARNLFEDLFLLFGDGHVIPRQGEGITAGLAHLVGGLPFWIYKMSYYPLADLFGSVTALTIQRLIQMVIYLVGAPLLYRLLRYGQADRWVAVSLAATYAISPVILSRMLLSTALPPATFLLWSEVALLEGRQVARVIGLVTATLSYPLTGFSAVLLAFQDYVFSDGRQRQVNRRVLFATAAALALLHFAIFGMYQHAVPAKLQFGPRVFEDMLGYRVFPVDVGPVLAQPLKLFEIAAFIAGSCVFLLAHPRALVPAIADLVYYGATTEGVRDHGMVLSSIGLFTILGVRAGLFVGGVRWRNRALVGASVFATLYGHAVAGRDGFLQLALAPAAPRPHLADIAACVPRGQKRCLVLPSLYPAFAGHCEEVATYEPAELKGLRVDDTDTTVFVAPTRLANDNMKGHPYEGTSNEELLGALAAKVRAGQLHASLCTPWFVLIRAAQTGPSDPGAVDRLEAPQA